MALELGDIGRRQMQEERGAPKGFPESRRHHTMITKHTYEKTIEDISDKLLHADRTRHKIII